MVRVNNPLPASVYTGSLRWLVMLIYIGENSLSFSMVWIRLSIPFPFKGGSISKENAVPG